MPSAPVNDQCNTAEEDVEMKYAHDTLDQEDELTVSDFQPAKQLL